MKRIGRQARYSVKSKQGGSTPHEWTFLIIGAKTNIELLKQAIFLDIKNINDFREIEEGKIPNLELYLQYFSFTSTRYEFESTLQLQDSVNPSIKIYYDSLLECKDDVYIWDYIKKMKPLNSKRNLFQKILSLL